MFRAPDEVLATLASRFPLVSNVRVVTTKLPREENPTETTDVRTVTYDLAVDSTVGSDATEAVWQGDLLTGAMTDEFLARGFERVPLARATLVTPDGRRHPLGGGIGNVVGGQVFHEIPAGLAETVAARAARIGLRDVRLTTIRPLQDAIEIVGIAPDPAKAVAAPEETGGLAGLLGVDPVVFEGVLLRINDGSGTAVLFQSQAARNGSWLRWTDPALATDE